jgi:hypothetical protein
MSGGSLNDTDMSEIGSGPGLFARVASRKDPARLLSERVSDRGHVIFFVESTVAKVSEKDRCQRWRCKRQPIPMFRRARSADPLKGALRYTAVASSGLPDGGIVFTAGWQSVS